MHRGRLPIFRWAFLLALGLVSTLLLACLVPSVLTRTQPTLSPSPTAGSNPGSGVRNPTLALPATPQPNRTRTVTRVTEQELNGWLQETQSLGEGIECQDMQATIRKTGIVISGNVRVAQLRSDLIPMEIELRPEVQGEHLEVQVLEVRLGGAYAGWSALIRPLISTGIDQAFDADRLLTEQGVHIQSLELQDGYMTIISEASVR